MQRVIERILNLLAYLLTVGRPVSAEQIRYTVAGYDQETDEAFRRTFERDKDLLRRLGVPLTLIYTDGYEVEQGYRIAPDEYALEDPGLTDEERAALGYATRIARLGAEGASQGALRKLGGAPFTDTGEPLAADLGADPGVLSDLFAAVVERRTASFTYRDRARTVQPLGLVHRLGHWYLVARVGGDDRTFRVDRIGELTTGSASHAFTRPKGFSAASVVPASPWEAGVDAIDAEVRFDADVAWWARRQVGSRATVHDEVDGSLRATMPVASPDAFIGWMLGFEERAEILAPPELRARFVAHVTGAP